MYMYSNWGTQRHVATAVGTNHNNNKKNDW